MKKTGILLAICIGAFFVSSAQNKGNIELEVLFGYQKHDKRFFGQSGSNSSTDEAWGTTLYGIQVKKNLFTWEWMRIQVGLGYARETHTYNTPYDLCFDNPGSPCLSILTWIDRYNIDLIQTPVNIEIPISTRLNLDLGFIPQFDFHKKVEGYGETSRTKMGLYAIQCTSGLEYGFNRLKVNLSYRWLQLKTVDEVYLYGNTF